jgi:hypothetical protein
MIEDRNIARDASIQLSKLEGAGLISTPGEVFWCALSTSQEYTQLNGKVADDRLFTRVETAIQSMVANRGDILIVAQDYVEDASNAVMFDADKAGISIVGLGQNQSLPRFDFNHANATIDIGANDILLANLIGIEIESGVTGTMLANIEWMVGEAGDGTDEFVKALRLVSGNHDTVMKNLRILAHASAGAATHGIHVDAASNRLTFDGVVIDGPYATNGILEDAAGLNHVAKNCSVDTTGTNYGFHASSTFAERRGNLDAGLLEAEGSATEILGADNSNNTFASTNVAANADGSMIERLESIQDALFQAGGVATFPAAAAAANAVSIAEVIRYMSELQIPRIVLKESGDLTAFGTTKTLFTVTGDVLIRVGASVDVAVTSTSGTTTLEVGVAGNTAALCVQDAVDATAFDVGDSWSLITAADANGAQMADEWLLIGNGVDVMLTGSVDDITAGEIDFSAQYIPLTAGSSVVAAA